MRSKIYIKGRLTICTKFVTIWVVTRGRGVKQTVGGGSQKLVVAGDILFEWPLTTIWVGKKIERPL